MVRPVTSWSVDPNADAPPSRQLVEAALDAMASGVLRAGDRLPSVRALAAEALVNANTVARAYRDLEALGATRGENGRGVFVTDEGEEIARRARSSVTLDAFRRAAHEALRAGHRGAALADVLMEEEGKRNSA